MKKKVSFVAHANVVLIPTVDEYHAAGLAPRLWWNDCDFRAFKSSAAKEVQQFLKDRPHVNSKGALKMYCEFLGREEEEQPQTVVEVTALLPSALSTAPSVEVKVSEPEECSENVNNANIVIDEPANNTIVVECVSTPNEIPNSNDNNNTVIIVTTNKEDTCVGNMNVHIFSYDRIRSDSLTNNPGPRRLSVPIMEAIRDDMNGTSATTSSTSSTEDMWTVFNLLPDNRSSEAFVILAQLFALASLSMIQSYD